MSDNRVEIAVLIFLHFKTSIAIWTRTGSGFSSFKSGWPKRDRLLSDSTDSLIE